MTVNPSPRPKVKALAGIGHGMRVAGNGSMAAAASEAGAAPGAGKPGAPKHPNYHPQQVLKELEAGKLLTGKQMTQGARAITSLELRPQLHEYQELANQLTKERNEEASGLGKLGNQLQGNVTDVYNNLGASNAAESARLATLGGELTAGSGAIAGSTNASLAGMQAGQLGDYTKSLQMRGAPEGGGAQAALASAVAAQQSDQVASNQASQQLAGSQAAGAQQLAAGLAGATGLSGAEAVGGIGSAIVGRVGEANQKYRENIQSALGKKAEVKATKGALFSKNLLDLREKEQKFKLGEQAVQSEKGKLALETKEAAQEKQEHGQEERRKWAEYGLSKWKAHHPNAGKNLELKKLREGKHDKHEVSSLIESIVGASGRPPENKKELNGLIVAINSKSSADPTLVTAVVENWWKGIHQGNRGIPGTKKVPYAP